MLILPQPGEDTVSLDAPPAPEAAGDLRMGFDIPPHGGFEIEFEGQLGITQYTQRIVVGDRQIEARIGIAGPRGLLEQANALGHIPAEMLAEKMPRGERKCRLMRAELRGLAQHGRHTGTIRRGPSRRLEGCQVDMPCLCFVHHGIRRAHRGTGQDLISRHAGGSSHR